MYKRQIVGLPCCENSATIGDDNGDNYIEYLPVRRMGILIPADLGSKEIIKCFIETDKNTKRDWTKITNVDGFYELIMGSNLVYYSCDIGEESKVKGYYVNNNNVIRVSKDENYYVKIRWIYDDGG